MEQNTSIHWQSASTPIPAVPNHPTDPVAAYSHLLTSSPTISADQPLLTYIHQGRHTTFTVPMLSQAMSALLEALGLDAGPFSLHSLRRGGAMAVYRQGLDHIDITRQGLWFSDAFWQYLTSSCAATSSLAVGLTSTIQATTQTTLTPSSSASYLSPRNHTTESLTQPQTSLCVYHIPPANPHGFPSSAQAAQKLSGASFGCSHYVVFFIIMFSLVCFVITLLLYSLSYYVQRLGCTPL